MAEKRPAIVVPDQPSEADRAAVVAALVAYNDKAGGPGDAEPLAVLIQDPATGKTVGGLWGRTIYDWLYVELFVVPETFRGRRLGSTILKRAEDIALARGCIGVWLNTYEFQAPDFYTKQGYELFGSIDDHPLGQHRFFFKKYLV
jgi:GNAT superfamily N-acetyltransferase